MRDFKSHKPSSMILFLSICSLTKSTDGDNDYSETDSIASLLPREQAQRLLARRDKVRRFVQGSGQVDWQGIPLNQLEFNRDLAAGQDFGGRRTANFLPALDRYQGRLFQALGPDRKQKVAESKHHLLLLSGLYGLLRPLEPIQLYSCPLKYQIAEIWDEDDLLTDVLCEYIRNQRIAKVIDLTAMDAYRKLIDWERVSNSETEVLHVLDTMAAGDYALTAFGRLLASDLLQRTEVELVNLEHGSRLESTIFQSTSVEQKGLPNEFDRSPPRPVAELGEGLRGGIPESPSGRQPGIGSGDEWQFATTRLFERDVRHRRDMYPQILRAAIEICRDPITPLGNTVKPLSSDYAVPGAWRYRIGDYRLVYVPDQAKRKVNFHRIKHRSDVYSQ